MKGTNEGSASSRGHVFAFTSLLVGFLLCASATTARGDALAKPTNQIAYEHLKAGNRLYRLREFEKAIEEYKAGAVREDVPVFYYNLGQCYRQLGRYDDAIWHYERFLDRGKPTGEVEAAVEGFIAQMRDELEKKAMKQPPVEPAPPSTAGSPSLGQSKPAAPPPEERRGMPLQRKLALATGTAGLALVAVGVGFGLRARSFEDDAAEICPMASCARADEANEMIDRGKANARHANVTFSAGGVAMLGAAVLWITGSPAERKNATIVPQVSRTFAGVAASMRF